MMKIRLGIANFSLVVSDLTLTHLTLANNLLRSLCRFGLKNETRLHLNLRLYITLLCVAFKSTENKNARRGDFYFLNELNESKLT